MGTIERIIQNNRQLKTNSTKGVVLIYEHDGELNEGVLVDPDQLKRLASWLCDWSFCNHRDDPEHLTTDIVLKGQRLRNGGFCDSCRDDAAQLMTQCPYIDM